MSEHRASELTGSSLVTKNKNPEGELTGENLNELKTGLHQILREIREFNTGSSSDDVNLQRCTVWLTSLKQFIEKISQHFPLEEAKQSNIQRYTATLETCRYVLLQKFLRFGKTQPSLFKPKPADLTTANRLDPYGRYIDLEAVAELYKPNFWLGIKSQIKEIAKRLIEIIEEKSDKELQEELEEFNRELKEINKAADREILQGILYHLFRKTIRTADSRVGGAETKRLTIMELVSNLLGEIQASGEDEKISQALEQVKDDRNLYSRLRDFINHIPISGSINPENIEKYKDLFQRLSKPEGREIEIKGREVEIKGREVEITLRDTSKLSYLRALLEMINNQEQEILDILNGSFKERGQELNVDVFTNALRFLIKTIEEDEASKKSSADVKKGVVSFETKEIKGRGIKPSREPSGELTMMVVTEAQGDVNKFISYPKYMLSLFDIDKISLVGK